VDARSASLKPLPNTGSQHTSLKALRTAYSDQFLELAGRAFLVIPDDDCRVRRRLAFRLQYPKESPCTTLAWVIVND
jgi:hypothetical protein